ncbi:hypothetical protein [Mucilaginibacter segetis]|uniref:Uncharacterized protein n=1 Tax=Mucilaginibacter segetis TaxID=2793071 RepID=A0A934UL26_9SPHI|nr:hypothetical protein [Mucilaginibacter segetis]MBK0378083.1 hypothetical protein [Mucilaginibacter segetis]
MRHLLAEIFHLFIIFMIIAFVVGGILAITGTFDHWGSRYILKRRRRRLLRNQNKNKRPYVFNTKNLYNNKLEGKPLT